eukprot:TRINITY_DN25049_c0_g1_i1.p1 TRINITY_DN25049_c0_g1~~TRINITY_DN25049_c0_g1_i1.p1  ORF type:complete len:500 (+),score=113.46 TRINITY_DN25049_c0_g1_i1:130-1629(+)
MMKEINDGLLKAKTGDEPPEGDPDESHYPQKVSKSWATALTLLERWRQQVVEQMRSRTKVTALSSYVTHQYLDQLKSLVDDDEELSQFFEERGWFFSVEPSKMYTILNGVQGATLTRLYQLNRMLDMLKMPALRSLDNARNSVAAVAKRFMRGSKSEVTYFAPKNIRVGTAVKTRVQGKVYHGYVDKLGADAVSVVHMDRRTPLGTYPKASVEVEHPRPWAVGDKCTLKDNGHAGFIMGVQTLYEISTANGVYPNLQNGQLRSADTYELEAGSDVQYLDEARKAWVNCVIKKVYKSQADLMLDDGRDYMKGVSLAKGLRRRPTEEGYAENAEVAVWMGSYWLPGVVNSKTIFVNVTDRDTKQQFQNLPLSKIQWRERNPFQGVASLMQQHADVVKVTLVWEASTEAPSNDFLRVLLEEGSTSPEEYLADQEAGMGKCLDGSCAFEQMIIQPSASDLDTARGVGETDVPDVDEEELGGDIIDQDLQRDEKKLKKKSTGWF